MKEDKNYGHVSYCMISASRINNSIGRNLFGSDVPCENYIEIEISSATMRRGYLGYDTFYPEKTILKVLLSQIQFAELLTNMNTTGVPCTLNYKDGEGYIEHKPVESRLDVSRSKFKDMFENGAEINSRFKKISETINGSRLSKKDKDEIIRNLDYLCSNLKSNAQYYNQVFQENADKIVADAKAQISAHKTHILAKLGGKKLEELIEIANKFKKLEG